MVDYETDPGKIHPNPFGFKTDPKEAENALREYLGYMATFFKAEISAPGQVESAWQRFQDAHDRDGILRLAFSINHVLGVQRDLVAMDDCDGNHDLGRLGSIQVLLHIGLIEFVEGGGYQSQFDWALRKRKAGALPELRCSFSMLAPWRKTVPSRDIKKFLVALQEEYNAERGSGNSVVSALNEGLGEADQKALLGGWIFSEPYPLGTDHEPGTRKHLYCRKRLEDWKAGTKEERKTILPFPNPEPCSQSCSPATSKEVREFLPVLVKDHLYRMRNELVHAASAVFIAATPNKEFLAWAAKDGVPINLSVTAVDGYFVGGGKLVTYEATVTVSYLNAILSRCLWNRLRGVKP